MAKYSVKKYNGDDIYSYAVFRAKDVKGKGYIIFDGEATPIVCGLSRQEALHHKKGLESK